MIKALLETMDKIYKDDIHSIRMQYDNEITMEIHAEKVKEICCFIYSSTDSALTLMFANDEREQEGCFSLYYTFVLRSLHWIFTIKIRLVESRLQIESISDTIPAAKGYEHEIRDMFGIIFTGHPEDRELIFHENWPSIINPLRKEFPVSKKPLFLHKQQEIPGIKGEDVQQFSLGPVYGVNTEPVHFWISTAGESIYHMEAKLYYSHRGIEKLCEDQSVEKALYIVERICGDETFANSLAYCQAIEKMTGTKAVPQRAAYTRVVFSELERLCVHLEGIAAVCTAAAFTFAVQQCHMMLWWCRTLNEELTGSRFLRSTNKPGGIRKDYIRGKEAKILNAMKKLYKEFSKTADILQSNSQWIRRVEDTGAVHKTVTEQLNAVGPVARCAGLQLDTRRDYPYAAYDAVKFNVPVYHAGDVNSRQQIRITEVLESIRIITQCIQQMPGEGSWIDSVTALPPYSAAYGVVEAPRGETVHWIMAGENNTLFRCKIRTASFCHWPILLHTAKQNLMEDFPLLQASFHLSCAGNDV